MSIKPLPGNAPMLHMHGRGLPFGTPLDATIHPAWLAYFSSLQQYTQPLGGNGPTTMRPINGLYIGQDFFDTTLGYKVTVKTLGPPVVWVNGAGTPV
jgi:hypothetical protein